MPHEINTTDLADSFGLTVQQVNNYVHAGMPKLGRGRFDLGACWKWRYQQKELELEGLRADKPDEELDRLKEDALLKRSQRKKIDIENARRMGEILEASHVITVVERAVSAMRTRVLGIPTKSAPRVVAATDTNEVKAILEADCHDALSELGRIPDDIAAIRAIADADVPGGDTSPQADDKPVGGRRKIPQSRGKRRTRAVAD